MDFKSCVSDFNFSNAFDVMTYARHLNLCEMYENRKSSNSNRTVLQPRFFSDTPKHVMMFKYNTGKENIKTIKYCVYDTYMYNKFEKEQQLQKEDLPTISKSNNYIY